MLNGTDSARQCGFQAIELLKAAYDLEPLPRAFPVGARGGIGFDKYVRVIIDETKRGVVIKAEPQLISELADTFSSEISAGRVSFGDTSQENIKPCIVCLYKPGDLHHMAFYDPQNQYLVDYNEVAQYLSLGWVPAFIVELQP